MNRIPSVENDTTDQTSNALRNITSPRVADHTFNQLKRYYEEKGFTINQTFLENLDFYTTDKKLNYAAYLFADINSISIKVAKYAGTNKVDLIENKEYGYCSLIKATDSVLDKLDIENRTLANITGEPKFLQKRLIDRTALREALLNAIVHNDYSREVTPVIEIYADRLTITSYGSLVAGLSKEEFFNGRSMLRNREIMRIYKDLDLVEQLGSGMSRITEKYPQNIYHFSENFIEVCFPFANNHDNKNNTSGQYAVQHNPTQQDVKGTSGQSAVQQSTTRQSVSQCDQPQQKEQESASQESASQESASQESASQESASQESASQESASQESASQESASHFQGGKRATRQVKKLVMVLQEEMSRKELMDLLRLTGRSNFDKLYLQPALERKMVEMTLPEKPNSRLQKYRLTSLGLQINKQLMELKYDN